MNLDDFIGREAELRATLSNVDQGHNTLVIGEEGVGKTAFLEVLHALLDTHKVIYIERVAPFGTFLRDLFSGLWDYGVIPNKTKDIKDDLKTWGRDCPNNDAKARYLNDLLAKLDDVVLLIDDASGSTPTSRPHLEELVEVCTVVATVSPNALKKAGTKRFWKRFEEVRLERFNQKESNELLEKKIDRYSVTADDLEVYKRKVLALSQGSPFEIDRLVKYHSSQSIVRTGELATYAQSFVERDEKGIALAPILLIFGAFIIAGRYIARAQGNLDLYVLSGIGIGLLVVLGPWLRSALRTRSS
jgi:energy-coupling factor transporter ATP-binding protein EcfA2